MSQIEVGADHDKYSAQWNCSIAALTSIPRPVIWYQAPGGSIEIGRAVAQPKQTAYLLAITIFEF